MKIVTIRQKFFHCLNEAIGLTTIKRWCKMTDDTDSINLALLLVRPHIIRSKGDTNKIIKRLQISKIMYRTLAVELIIFRDDLGRWTYKFLIELARTHEENVCQLKKDKFSKAGKVDISRF